MEDKKKCPECGSVNFSQGVWKGYGALMPAGKVFSMGSEVLAELCTNCGLIVNLRVGNPQKFK